MEKIDRKHPGYALKSLLLASAMMPTNKYLDAITPRFKEFRNVPEYARKNEQSRNEQCACGSGLKYKKCCGI